MWNLWEPWACFPETSWSHLGVMGDGNPWSEFLMSGLLHNILVAITAENPASQRWDVGNGNRLFSVFVEISGYFALTLIQNIWRFDVVSCIGEGNGNPLRCSCLENSRDRGAWRAAIYGVAQSRTRLKWLSSSSSSISIYFLFCCIILFYLFVAQINIVLFTWGFLIG